MTDLDLAAIMVDHHPVRAYHGTEDTWCPACDSLDVPCLPYRLAAALVERDRLIDELREMVRCLEGGGQS